MPLAKGPQAICKQNPVKLEYFTLTLTGFCYI